MRTFSDVISLVAACQVAPEVAVVALIPIAHGLKYLHGQEFVHRDIKPDNILVGVGTHPSVQTFLCDFGECRHMATTLKDSGKQASKQQTREAFRCITATATASRRGTIPARRPCGTLSYSSPESASGNRHAPSDDIYSFGMVMLTVFLGVYIPQRCLKPMPTTADGIRDAIRAGRAPEIPARCPEQLRLIISQCLSHNPVNRPTAQNLCVALEDFSKSIDGATTLAPLASSRPRVNLHLLRDTDSSGQGNILASPKLDTVDIHEEEPARLVSAVTSVSPATITSTTGRQARLTSAVSSTTISSATTASTTSVRVQAGSTSAVTSAAALCAATARANVNGATDCTRTVRLTHGDKTIWHTGASWKMKNKHTLPEGTMISLPISRMMSKYSRGTAKITTYLNCTIINGYHGKLIPESEQDDYDGGVANELVMFKIRQEEYALDPTEFAALFAPKKNKITLVLGRTLQ